jgi:hypothetical protein
MTYMGEKGDVYKVLVEETRGRSTFGRARCRWENDIIIHIHEVE